MCEYCGRTLRARSRTVFMGHWCPLGWPLSQFISVMTTESPRRERVYGLAPQFKHCPRPLKDSNIALASRLRLSTNTTENRPPPPPYPQHPLSLFLLPAPNRLWLPHRWQLRRTVESTPRASLGTEGAAAAGVRTERLGRRGLAWDTGAPPGGRPLAPDVNIRAVKTSCRG